MTLFKAYLLSGGSRGGAALFVDPKIWGDQPPPYLRVWMTVPPLLLI